jgi:hypothetical protein
MFYLKSGRIDMCRYTPSRATKSSFHRARAGETFCEAAMFSPRYHCDVIAAEPRIDRDQQGRCPADDARDPDFAMAISARFAGQIQDYRRGRDHRHPRCQ